MKAVGNTWQWAERWGVDLDLQAGAGFPSKLLSLLLISSWTDKSNRLSGLLLEASVILSTTASPLEGL